MLNLQLFNISREELNTSKHNIFIGISMGVKPLSRDIALSYMDWAEKYSAVTVPILIVDEIAKFNYLVFSHSTKPGALSRSLRDGDKYQLFLEKIIFELPASKKNRFKIIRWKDIQTERFYMFLGKITTEFETNPSFREIMLHFIDIYTANRNKNLTLQKKLFLCQYLLYELPILLDGIIINNINYDLMVYPTYKHSGMSELVVDIQTGKRFPNLTKILAPKKTMLAEFLINSPQPSIFPLPIY